MKLYRPYPDEIKIVSTQKINMEVATYLMIDSNN